jgi:hypothetical protein
MGVSYYVALHGQDWPTAAALQECIDYRGWPIKLGSAYESQWLLPFNEVRGTSGLPLTLRGDPVELEASIATLSPTESYSYTLDAPSPSELKPELELEGGVKAFRLQELKFRPVDINETLNSIGATDVRFGYGDRVLTLTFRSSQREWQAGFYLMAALIKCFNGYGFEPHNGRGGKSEYADTLLGNAAKLELNE